MYKGGMTGYGYPMFGGSSFLYSWAPWLQLIAMLAITVAVVWIAVMLYRRWQYPQAVVRKSESPLEIIQLRLAKGEISPEEYTRLKNELQPGGASD